MYYEFEFIVNVLLGFYVFFGGVVVSVMWLFVMVVFFICVKYRFVISMFCLNNLFFIL